MRLIEKLKGILTTRDVPKEFTICGNTNPNFIEFIKKTCPVCRSNEILYEEDPSGGKGNDYWIIIRSF